MRLSRVTKTFGVWALFWLLLIAAYTLIATFPIATKMVGLGACIAFLLFTTWKLAETYIND
jgi:hypothetical protein